MRIACIALASFVVCACAQSDPASSASDSGVDARGNDAIAIDSAARDLGPDDVHSDGIFPTEDTGADATTPPDDTPPADTYSPPDTVSVDTTPPVCATPSGSTATASGAYMSAPTDAIDGNEGTTWNSGDYSGWIDIKFPHGIYFDRIRVAGNSLPDCTEPYTFTGYLSGAPTALGSASFSVTGATTWMPTVAVPAGVYDELRVDVGASASWIAVAEIVVYDSAGGCGLP